MPFQPKAPLKTMLFASEASKAPAVPSKPSREKSPDDWHAKHADKFKQNAFKRRK